MKQIMKFELYRAFHNKMFVVALGIGCAIATAHIFITVIPDVLYELEMWRLYGASQGAYPPSLFNSWLGGRSNTLEFNLYFLLLPLLICIPHADTFFTDRSGCYVRNISQRGDYKKYYVSKVISIFLTAGCVAVIPLILNLFLTSLFVPALQPIPATSMFPIFEVSMWSGTFYSNPLLYLFMYFTLIFLFAGLLSLLTIPFSYLVANRVLVMLSPFIICVFVDFLSLVLSPELAGLSPLSIMRPDQAVPINFVYAVAEFATLFLILIGFAVYRAKTDEVY